MTLASMVYDGTSIVSVPHSMMENGPPLADQMVGMPLEQLGECASRICYDSLGNDPITTKRRGRSSAALHAHILEVINLSVYEHGNFTIRFSLPSASTQSFTHYLHPLMNRKGIWVDNPAPFMLDITTNLRAILEWDRHTKGINLTHPVVAYKLMLEYWGNQLAPQIIRAPDLKDMDKANRLIESSSLVSDSKLTADQAWITLYLYGSRGFTHEQVRHRFAMSQRSTRYVDESDSAYVTHPLVKKYLNDYIVPRQDRVQLEKMILESIDSDKATYRAVVQKLEAYNIQEGVDKQTARKQARGAARGYLGNALASEMLFSAPVSGWKWMLNQRLSSFADAEIREVYAEVLPCLQNSAHSRFFENYCMLPSPDKMGSVLHIEGPRE